MPDIDKIRSAATKFFSALNADPGALSLGAEVQDAAWKLHHSLQPSKEKTPSEQAAQQAANPHDHQDYCEGCESITDMKFADVTCCSICEEKYA